MPEVICNASPLLYLHRLGALEWLHSLFSEVWVPAAVIAVLTLALEHRDRIVLLDDGLARRISHAAGLTVWGTLRVLLQAKERGFISSIAPLLDALAKAGMWMSEDIRQRVLTLAGEDLGRS